ncbi:hypothetical protein D3C85_1773150 [compost metagenome]
MSTTIRCKMVCHNIWPQVETDPEGQHRVRLGAVWSANPCEENAIFGKLTPFGEIQLSVTAQTAGHLEVGAEYYIDIHKAE